MKTCKYTLTKRMTMLGLAFTLSVFFLSSCSKNNDNNYVPPPPVAYLSFIQASPDVASMDFYLNDNLINITPIAYGSSTDYFRAYPGLRTASFYNHGSTTKIFSDTVRLNANVGYSLFLTNAATANPSLVLLTDSISTPPTGKATIRFVDVSPDAPAVDLAFKDSTNTLVSNKIFKGFSSFLPVQGSKSYTFEVRQHGTSTVLATLANVTLDSGSVYTIWLHGLAGSSNVSDKLSADLITNARYYYY